jgi:hypothetical protein
LLVEFVVELLPDLLLPLLVVVHVEIDVSQLASRGLRLGLRLGGLKGHIAKEHLGWVNQVLLLFGLYWVNINSKAYFLLLGNEGRFRCLLSNTGFAYVGGIRLSPKDYPRQSSTLSLSSKV